MGIETIEVDGKIEIIVDKLEGFATNLTIVVIRATRHDLGVMNVLLVLLQQDDPVMMAKRPYIVYVVPSERLSTSKHFGQTHFTGSDGDRFPHQVHRHLYWDEKW